MCKHCRQDGPRAEMSRRTIPRKRFLRVRADAAVALGEVAHAETQGADLGLLCVVNAAHLARAHGREVPGLPVDVVAKVRARVRILRAVAHVLVGRVGVLADVGQTPRAKVLTACAALDGEATVELVHGRTATRRVRRRPVNVEGARRTPVGVECVVRW